VREIAYADRPRKTGIAPRPAKRRLDLESVGLQPARARREQPGLIAREPITMKILFAQAPARKLAKEALIVPPLGIAYLAAVARKAGHDVSVLDAFAEGLTLQQFASRVAEAGADMVGITGMTPVFDTVRDAIVAARPHARWLVLGGPHATSMREKVMQENPELDFAVCGEGEVSFMDLIAALEDGRSPTGIPGVVTKDGVGPIRPMLNALDELPFPARDLLPNARYRYPLCLGRRVTTMITSRGCPYTCIFCDKSVFGSRWRARSAENVLAEIDEVVKRYGVNTIIFYDDLFTLKTDRLKAICRGLIERKYNLTWKAEGRVDLADEFVLHLMRKAGCDTIAYGVETVNQHGLDYLGKRTRPDQVRKAFKLTRAAGIKTMGYYILGIPVETYADAVATVRFAIELKTDYAQFSVLSPLPGTRLYQDAVERGWYREIAAHNIADKDRLRPVVMSDNWDEAALISIVRQAHRMFYMRPSYALRRVFGARSFGEIAGLTALGCDMARYLLRSPGSR